MTIALSNISKLAILNFYRSVSPPKFLRHSKFIERNSFIQLTSYASESRVKNAKNMVRILNVAEKNDAAKNLAEILSRGGYTRREGFSKFNKIYEFEMMFQGQRSLMLMTSVSGHLLNQAFTGHFRGWNNCNPLDLFAAPVIKACQENMQPIKRTLEQEARRASQLVIWTDCDREGENIGFEIIEVCKAINPNLAVSRAKFSEITFQSVNRAMQTLGPPDEKQSQAVDVRSELDLRIGAAFTRFQTLRLQRVFPQSLSDTLISYGSCQFPTLGFVVERYKAIEKFIPENFWKIKVSHETENCVVEFLWQRVRLFNELACQVLFERCQERPEATVLEVKTRPKSKWRPLPLDTVELEKLGSRKLRINAKEIMRVAEKLYTSGYISYPRTETNIFPKELDLNPLVQMQSQDQNWGEFASHVFEEGPNPRQGRKSDQAHPPIHPTKYANNLQGNEKTVYEFIVRHFLACLSKDAKGTETVVQIDVNEEKFSASGLIILERNYLDVYPYDKWSDKEMPHYQENQVFEPSMIEMIHGETSPPALLTEADLISLMEKHGIGTDATHAEHIETIKSRMYVGLQDNRFVPGELGMGLVDGYDAMGFEMSKPFLRSNLEADLKRICEGTKDPAVVLQEQIQNYKNVFEEALRQANKIDQALGLLLTEAPQNIPQSLPMNIPQYVSLTKCANCHSDIILKSKKDKKGFFLSCSGFPVCKASLWFPDSVTNVTILEEICQQCSHHPKKLKFQFIPRVYFPRLPNEYTSCVGGCDTLLLETLGIREFPSRAPSLRISSTIQNSSGSLLDSGYSSSSTSQRVSNPRLPLNSLDNVNNRGARNTDNLNSFSTRQVNQNSSLPTQIQGGALTDRTSNSNMPQKSTFITSQNFDNHGGSNSIVCNCNEDALRLTVKKEGPNKGRQFYRCAKPMGQGCNFFLWANENEDRLAGGGGPPDNDDWGGGGGGSSSTIAATQNSRAPEMTLTRNDTWATPSTSMASSSAYSSSFVPTNSSQSGSNDIPNCTCGIPSIRRTVAKEGPNKGRPFYGCTKFRPEGCNFFQWADDTGVQNSQTISSSYDNWSNRGQSSNLSNTTTTFTDNSSFDDEFDDGSSVLCSCGVPAKRLTVFKEGPNKGRHFYCCSRPRSEQCGFFQWDDADASQDFQPPSFSSSASSSRGRGSGTASWGARGSSRGSGVKRKLSNEAPKKRKCGICGVEGHTRKTCPNNY